MPGIVPEASAQEPPPAYPAPPVYGPGDPPVVLPGRPRPQVPMRTARPHALYADLGGRGIFYGVGYDYCALDWLALGVSFSYFTLDSVAHVLVNPYITFYPARGIRNALYLAAGANFVHFSGPSKVIGIDVLEADGFGVWGNVSLGWEYRSAFLLRLGPVAFYSDEGFVPWFSLSLGGSL